MTDHASAFRIAAPFLSVTAIPHLTHRIGGQRLSVCPEMIFRLGKPFSNKAANYDCLTGRKTSLFSNFFGNPDYNNLKM